MTSERLPWFPCYPTKLLGALAGMKAPEGYVYVIVLLRIYESNGPCRDSLDALATRARLNRRIVSDALDKLFKAGRLHRETDGIHNPIADDVLAEANAFREERKRAGEKGASRRWGKIETNQRQADSKANAQPMANDGHLHLQSQEQKRDKKEKEPTLALSGGIAPPSDGWPPNAWEKFYGRYPHKVGKAAARKAFDKVRRQHRAGFDEMMFGLERYVAKTDDRPWCNPATWLNEDRWQDEPAPNGGGDGKHRNEGTSGARPGGGHRSWASYAASRARAASGEGS